jgi:hypothetical protein
LTAISNYLPVSTAPENIKAVEPVVILSLYIAQKGYTNQLKPANATMPVADITNPVAIGNHAS